MTPEQFCYWLQGKLEGRDILTFGDVELKMIQDHLETVFKKVTPNIHSGTATAPGNLGGLADMVKVPHKQATCTCGTALQACPVHPFSPFGTILC